MRTIRQWFAGWRRRREGRRAVHPSVSRTPESQGVSESALLRPESALLLSEEQAVGLAWWEMMRRDGALPGVAESVVSMPESATQSSESGDSAGGGGESVGGCDCGGGGSGE